VCEGTHRPALARGRKREPGAQRTKPDCRVSGMLHAGLVEGLGEGQPSRSVAPTARRMFLRRVGAHLAVRAPPGTVRAILTAYGSTSETTERHIFQRGQCSVTFVSSPQLGLRPLVDETQVAPIVITTGLSGDNVVAYDFGGILQR
jgi:hypothetical protein